MKKFILILGLLTTTGFVASRFFSSSPKEELKPISVTASQPVAEAPEPIPNLPSFEENEILPMPAEVAQGFASPSVEERSSRVPATISKTVEPLSEEELPAANTHEVAKPIEHERKEPLAAQLSAESVASEDAQEPELLFAPHVGYGAKYIKFQQSGAFGGGDGLVNLASGPSVGVNLKYGQWSFAAGFENMGVKFPVDSTTNTKEKKDFKTLSLKGGYGIFYLGAKARTAPLVRAGTTTLTWADITTIEALGGLRVKKLYAGRRKKPFLLGGELEGSTPISVSANGGPAISKSSGFGLSLKGYAEKAFVEGEAVQLKIGLEISAAYEQSKVEGTWSGSSGTVTRTIQEYGSKVYVGMEF
jgi:hypothetical protein